jgi:hypothetical protein
LLGTKGYNKLESDLITHYHALNVLTKAFDEKKMFHHVTVKLPLTVEALREGHKMMKDSSAIGKVTFGVDVKKECGEPFK